MRIDSHQHFWIYNAPEYPWISDAMTDIRRDFLPSTLKPELDGCRLDGSIAVQARQTIEESRWLLSLADQNPLIKGVVGWVDLRSEKAAQQLAQFAEHPRFVGVRHVVQDESDEQFMLQPEFLRGLGQLADFNLAYDLLVLPRQLEVAAELVRRFPAQTFILDHLGKPSIRTGDRAAWESGFIELSRFPNVYAKLSGLVTEAEWHDWRPKDLRPYLDLALERFGEDRLMFGSDWPVCLLSASYREVYESVNEFIERLPRGVQDKIFGANAAAAYKL